MRRPKLILWAVVLSASVALPFTTLRRSVSPQGEAVAAALLDLHHGWETNGGRLPSVFPARIKAMGLNGVEANRFWASAYHIDSICGFRWSKGYQLLRQDPNGVTWILARTYYLQAPLVRGLTWQRAMLTVTNAP